MYVVWEARGAGLGLKHLSPRYSRKQKSFKAQSLQRLVSEFRFFCTSPSEEVCDDFRPFCLMLYTKSGDLNLYEGCRELGEFTRVSLEGIVQRATFEEGRHRLKLVRKGQISKELIEEYEVSSGVLPS